MSRQRHRQKMQHLWCRSDCQSFSLFSLTGSCCLPMCAYRRVWQPICAYACLWLRGHILACPCAHAHLTHTCVRRWGCATRPWLEGGGSGRHRCPGCRPAGGSPQQGQPEPSVRRECCAASGHGCQDHCCAGNRSAGCHLPVQGSPCVTGPAWLTAEAPHRPTLGALVEVGRAQHGYGWDIPYSRALPSPRWLPQAHPPGQGPHGWGEASSWPSSPCL